MKEKNRKNNKKKESNLFLAMLLVSARSFFLFISQHEKRSRAAGMTPTPNRVPTNTTQGTPSLFFFFFSLVGNNAQERPTCRLHTLRRPRMRYSGKCALLSFC